MWINNSFPLIPVSVRSKTWTGSRSQPGIAGSNPAGAYMAVCCKCCVLSRTGVCVELITRPEESYRVWCRIVGKNDSFQLRLYILFMIKMVALVVGKVAVVKQDKRQSWRGRRWRKRRRRRNKKKKFLWHEEPIEKKLPCSCKSVQAWRIIRSCLQLVLWRP